MGGTGAIGIGPTTTVDDLLPGLPSAFYEDAADLRTTAGALDHAARCLGNVDVGNFVGYAREAYDADLASVRARMVSACDVFTGVADALEAHGQCLAWARSQVRHQLGVYQAALGCSAGGSYVDTGVAELIACAVTTVHRSERVTRSVLEAAADAGPPTVPFESFLAGDADVNPWHDTSAESGFLLQALILALPVGGGGEAGAMRLDSAEFEALAARKVALYTALADRSALPAWLRTVSAGKAFDWLNYSRYAAMEVPIRDLTTGRTYRVDSYSPGLAVVSRKYTQLAEVTETTALGYVTELTTKYQAGRSTLVIADTPNAVLQLGWKGVGKPLKGDMILEVPVQTAPVPASVLDAARKANVMIRDTNGHVYAAVGP